MVTTKHILIGALSLIVGPGCSYLMDTESRQLQITVDSAVAAEKRDFRLDVDPGSAIVEYTLTVRNRGDKSIWFAPCLPGALVREEDQVQVLWTQECPYILTGIENMVEIAPGDELVWPESYAYSTFEELQPDTGYRLRVVLRNERNQDVSAISEVFSIELR